jgi:hypothetical protein
LELGLGDTGEGLGVLVDFFLELDVFCWEIFIIFKKIMVCGLKWLWFGLEVFDIELNFFKTNFQIIKFLFKLILIIVG